MNPVLDAIAGGWKIQYIGNYSSGTPLNFPANSAAAGTNVGGNRALLTNPPGTGLGVPFDYWPISMPHSFRCPTPLTIT